MRRVDAAQLHFTRLLRRGHVHCSHCRPPKHFRYLLHHHRGLGCTGPVFGFSDTWQLIINTGTTIVTFLMVFLIQNTQNRDGAAIQAKLDELIRAGAAKNHFIGIDELTDEELEDLREKRPVHGPPRMCRRPEPKAEKAADRATGVT